MKYLPIIYTLDINGKYSDFWIVKGIIGEIEYYIKDLTINLNDEFITFEELIKLKIDITKKTKFIINLKSKNVGLFNLKQFIWFINKNNKDNSQEMLDLNTIKNN